MPNSRRRKSLAIAASVATLAAAGAAVAGAEAASANVCPDNVLCLFEHSSWGGNAVIITYPEGNLGRLSFNDRTTSFSNHTPTTWCLFDGSSWGGDKLITIAPYSAAANVGGWANDRATSVGNSC